MWSFWRAWSGNSSRHHYFLYKLQKYIAGSERDCLSVCVVTSFSCVLWHEREALFKQCHFSFLFMLIHCWIRHRTFAATVSAVWILSCKWLKCTCCLCQWKMGKGAITQSSLSKVLECSAKAICSLFLLQTSFLRKLTAFSSTPQIFKIVPLYLPGSWCGCGGCLVDRLPLPSHATA